MKALFLHTLNVTIVATQLSGATVCGECSHIVSGYFSQRFCASIKEFAARRAAAQAIRPFILRCPSPISPEISAISGGSGEGVIVFSSDVFFHCSRNGMATVSVRWTLARETAG